MLYRVWIQDVEKAITVFRKAFPYKTMICGINGNAHGDYILIIDENERYLVKHDDFSIWKCPKDWREKWQKVYTYEEEEDDIGACMRESVGENWY